MKRSFRVVLPRKLLEVIALANRIIAKHKSEGANSPLSLLQDNNWNETESIVSECLKNHQEAEEYGRKMEELYRARDAKLKQIDGSIKASRDLLMGVYRETPKKMGDWGFDIDDSVRRAKK